MKSILVALDETPAAKTARAMALMLAERHRARVAALGVVDIDYLTAPEPVPIGGASFKARADVARVTRAHDRLEKLLGEFDRACRERGLKGRGIRIAGDPLAELLRAAVAHDLIVVGRDTSFHNEPSDETAATVGLLLRRNPRPVLVVPHRRVTRDPRTILIAYDGSIGAGRALQMFTLLGLAKDMTVHVISVARDEAGARALADQAGDYLALYRTAPHLHPIAANEPPAEIVAAEAARLKADILVMGAFGQRGWREALLGSCSKSLIAHCPTSLFVHH